MVDDARTKNWHTGPAYRILLRILSYAYPVLDEDGPFGLADRCMEGVDIEVPGMDTLRYHEFDSYRPSCSTDLHFSPVYSCAETICCLRIVTKHKNVPKLTRWE